jgi:pyocin large subunit-like protein
MIEVQTWLFVSMIIGLIAAGVMIGYQDDKIKKLKKKLKDKSV